MKKEIQNTIDLLNKLHEDPQLLAGLSEDQRIALLKAAGELSRPDRKEKKKRNKAKNKSLRQKVVKQERKSRAATGIRSAREAAVFTAPKQLTSNDKTNHSIRIKFSPKLLRLQG